MSPSVGTGVDTAVSALPAYKAGLLSIMGNTAAALAGGWVSSRRTFAFVFAVGGSDGS